MRGIERIGHWQDPGETAWEWQAYDTAGLVDDYRHSSGSSAWAEAEIYGLVIMSTGLTVRPTKLKPCKVYIIPSTDPDAVVFPLAYLLLPSA